MTKQLHEYLFLIPPLLIILGFVIYWPQRFIMPPYNRIQATVTDGGSVSLIPKSTLTVQRVKGVEVRTLVQKLADRYGISWRDFTDGNGQPYTVRPDGTIKKSGPMYSNDPYVSPSGDITLRFARQSTLKKGEEEYPGAYKTETTILNKNDIVVQKFDSKRYGDEYIDIVPLAFSTDEKYVFFQVWAMRGGDFIDRMSIVKQSIMNDTFTVIINNPSIKLRSNSSGEVINMYVGINPESHTLYFQELQMVDDFYSPSALFGINYETNQEVQRTIIDYGKHFQVSFSPNFQSYALLDVKSVYIGSMGSTKSKLAKFTIPDGCNIWDITNEGDYAALACLKDMTTQLWVYQVKSGWKRLLSTWPLDYSEMKTGEMYNYFAGFID